jgi:hypothetical protein
MVRDGEIVALSGKRIKVKVHTLCVHGDEATGVVVARGIRQALEAADILRGPADRHEAVRGAVSVQAGKTTIAIIGGTGALGAGLARALPVPAMQS